MPAAPAEGESDAEGGGKAGASAGEKAASSGEKPRKDPADLEAGGKSSTAADSGRQTSLLRQAGQVAFCVAGLQGSYLTWGLLQEQMMTQAYDEIDGRPIHFTNSNYLVLLNRALAFIVAFIIIKSTRQPRHTAPMYRYAFPSFSNLVSSWCQYEALRYVSFPTQVLAKSSKVIPVMIMGKFVQNKTYPLYEYICAVILSLGVSLFFFSKEEPHEGQTSGEEEEAGTVETLTTVAGWLLLIGYMAFDRWVWRISSRKEGERPFQWLTL